MKKRKRDFNRASLSRLPVGLNNKRMKHFTSLIHTTASTLTLALTLALGLTSCSEMHTDLPECEVELKFKYDYNTQRADMFTDQVGGLTLYVFDKDNRFLFKKDTANTATTQPLKDKNFKWKFNHNELAPGEYHLVTRAYQKSYEATLNTTGAKYRHTTLKKGDDIATLQTILDRDASGNVDHQNAPLDTLWAGRNIDTLRISNNRFGEYTLPLMRDTKQLNITLRQTVEPAAMNHEDYDVKIIDNNGRLLYDNDVDPTDTKLTYTPYAQWTTELQKPAPQRADSDPMRTAHYELFFNRLVWHTNNHSADARLIVTYKPTGEVIIDTNLPALLKDGRNAYELYNWKEQEYLDRESQYHLDLFLAGTKWKYIDLVIDVLSWAVRVQNVDL